jgi:hypothetical protein
VDHDREGARARASASSASRGDGRESSPPARARGILARACARRARDEGWEASGDARAMTGDVDIASRTRDVACGGRDVDRGRWRGAPFFERIGI